MLVNKGQPRKWCDSQLHSPQVALRVVATTVSDMITASAVNFASLEAKYSRNRNGVDTRAKRVFSPFSKSTAAAIKT